MINSVVNLLIASIGIIFGAVVSIAEPTSTIDWYGGIPVVQSWGAPFGLSLGPVIISNMDPEEVRHEYGHFEQWQLLQGLYPAIVALPSAIRGWGYKLGWKRGYHAFYTEAWADQLGGVQR